MSLTPAAQDKLAVATRYWRKAQSQMATRMGTESVRQLLRAPSGAVEAARAD